MKQMLFNVAVTQNLLYGIDVWGGIILQNAWIEIKTTRNIF